MSSLWTPFAGSKCCSGVTPTMTSLASVQPPVLMALVAIKVPAANS